VDQAQPGASIQQGDFNHRGEQGMFESLGFRAFRLAGVPAMHSAYAQFRVIDEVEEAPASDQYEGDFWGLYLILEQPDGRFLEQHGLPDGNFYKMEGGGGELNNLGPDGPADSSDLTSFLQSYNGESETWWRQNFRCPRLPQLPGRRPGHPPLRHLLRQEFLLLSPPAVAAVADHPWDLDLIWAENMYDAGWGSTAQAATSLNSTQFPPPGALAEPDPRIPRPLLERGRGVAPD
jgi:hypothetical protein